ncbi:MAG: methyl-accepting chemotaxis protein [Alphaproteobacteria bacterium]|nr:methyl-accepting chemotaxis protein [Alphaproteobacteria bacterium]
MEGQGAFILANNIIMYIAGGMGLLLVIILGMLFMVSRKSQRVMQSLLDLLLHPESVRVQDASKVLQTVLAGEVAKIESGFKTICDTLNGQIEHAKELKKQLGEQNEKLLATADDATKKLVQMSGRLDNTLGGLQSVVESKSWDDVTNTTDKFSARINELLAQINTTTNETTERINQTQTQIDSWIASSNELNQTLHNEFESNATQMQDITEKTEILRDKLATMTQSTVDGFNEVKTASADYADIMSKNNDMLDGHLNKMDVFNKQSKKLLTSQTNTIINTANVVSGQVRLTESSIEKQITKLSDAVEALMSSATATESAIRGISNELAGLTNRFDNEIKEFATGVVAELKTVSGVANITLENTKTAANAFSESVKTMGTGVRETLIEMNTAHTQLSGQSETLIKMSRETTEQLQPLSELIEKYYAALPDLSHDSVAAGETLGKIVSELNATMEKMKSTVNESTSAIAESATKLDELAGGSRQQMIDLMADYAKAVDTMQTLNKQMMVARASAPMDAIKSAPAAQYGRISTSDFLSQSEKMFSKMHEQSIDLTRATGVDIPDTIWKKYHDGDTAIFSKWLAKMLSAADKKQIRETLKNDSVFRSQATQFVRSFAKVMTSAESVDNPDKVAAALLKTDLGKIYVALKGHI